MVAGHLLDPRLDMQAVFGHGFNAVMYAWAQWAAAPAPDHLRDLGSMMLQRLISQYTVLLSGKHAGLSTSDKRARPLGVAAIWTLIVGEAYRSSHIMLADYAVCIAFQEIGSLVVTGVWMCVTRPVSVAWQSLKSLLLVFCVELS